MVGQRRIRVGGRIGIDIGIPDVRLPTGDGVQSGQAPAAAHLHVCAGMVLVEELGGGGGERLEGGRTDSGRLACNGRPSV